MIPIIPQTIMQRIGPFLNLNVSNAATAQGIIEYQSEKDDLVSLNTAAAITAIATGLIPVTAALIHLLSFTFSKSIAQVRTISAGRITKLRLASIPATGLSIM